MAKKNPDTPRPGTDVSSELKLREPSAQDQKLNENGYEVLSPRPMELPIGYVRTPPLEQQIREMVKSALLAREAEAMGAETFEEADDFDVGDDYDPRSPYEEVFEPPIPANDNQPDAPPPPSEATPNGV